MKCGVAECAKPRVGALDWCPAHGVEWEAAEVEHYAGGVERFRSRMRYLGDAVDPRHAEIFERNLLRHLDLLFEYAGDLSTDVPACQGWCGGPKRVGCTGIPECWGSDEGPCFCTIGCRQAGRPLNLAQEGGTDGVG